MAWFNDLKDKFSKRRIRSLDRTKEYGRDFIDLDSANRIGIIINVDDCDAADLKLLEDYIQALKGRKKKLVIIEISSDKKGESRYEGREEIVIFINPTKVNWLDYPTPAIESEIQSHEMDILMDFDRSSRMASKYVCSMAKAKTRTGMHREGLESCYELMITPSAGLVTSQVAMKGEAPSYDSEIEALGPNEKPDLKSVIKEFDYFLNMIDNGKRVKA